jgi:hypothetical protein
MKDFPLFFLLMVVVSSSVAGTAGLFPLFNHNEVENFVASGFKNGVFKFGENILRVSFGSSLNYRKEYRGREHVGDFLQLQRQWKENTEKIANDSNISIQQRLLVNKCSHYNITVSNLHYLLSKLVENEHQIKNRDIIPLKHIKDERVRQARASNVPGLEFGVSAPIHEELIEIPQYSESNSFDNNTCAADDVQYFLMMEIQPELGKSLAQLDDEEHVFTEEQLIYLLISILQDQVNYHDSTKEYHYDGHAGNILLAKNVSIDDQFFSWVWSDFGKSSSISNQPSQMKNSIASVYNVLYNASNRGATSNSKISKLLKITKAWIEEGDLTGIPALLNDIKQAVRNGSSVRDIANISRIARNMSGFLTDVLVDKIDNLTNKVEELQLIQKEQALKFESTTKEQADQIEELRAQLSLLMKIK